MVSTFISLLDIQSWWEIPCIAHFCSLFSSAFSLPDIDIEDLESALLTDGTDESVGLLPELIVGLLKGCDDLTNRNEITTSNYQMFLRRFLRQQCRNHNTKNYFDTDIDFQSLPLRNKILILYSLCHFRLESANVQTILANLEADSLRVEPLGYDSKNSGYWYFYGTRLYREDTKPGGKSTVWQVICFTEEDWQNLAAKFKNSTSPKERALYKILIENFIPKLPQLFRERERLRRRKLLAVRTSARIHNLLEEKQRVLVEKQEADELERKRLEKLEEEAKLQAAAAAAAAAVAAAAAASTNKSRTRTRRRSQSSSAASGISTYASSIRVSSPSSEFLTQHETFCISPDLGDCDGESNNSPKAENDGNDSPLSFKANYLSTKESVDHLILGRYPTSDEDDDDNNADEILSNKSVTKNVSDDSVERLSGNHSNRSVNAKKRTRKTNSKVDSNRYRERSSDYRSSFGNETDATVARNKKEMAPTTNAKLPGRQTNNSLSSLPGNVFIPPSLSGSSGKGGGGTSGSGSSSASGRNSKSSKGSLSGSDSGKTLAASVGAAAAKEKSSMSSVPATNVEISSNQHRKKKSKGAETHTEKDELLQIGMHKVLLYVKNHRDAWPFVDPVDEEIAPRYYSIIRRPMDLQKMEEKLDNEEYKKYSDFRNDFKLIVNNCRLYNGQNNEYTEMVNNLQEAFDKATKKYLDQYTSDEDENQEYPDPRSTVFREKSHNKNNVSKVIPQKESIREVQKKGKEKETGKHAIESEEADEQDDDETIENSGNARSNKKKRKDKDKRRKKKSRTKQSVSVESDDDDDDGNADEDRDNSDAESDTKPSANIRSRSQHLGDRRESKDLEPPSAKRTKTKMTQKEKEMVAKERAGKSTVTKAPRKSDESKSKKSEKPTATKSSSKRLQSDESDEEAAKVSDNEEPKRSSESDHKGKKGSTTAKRKHSPVRETANHSKKKYVPVEKNSASKPKDEKASNQNAKSKSTASTSAKQNSRTTPRTQSKDNNTHSNGTKKRRSRLKEEIVVEEDEKCVEESSEKKPHSDDDENLSRCSSPPLFKVDLHKKYAKSASLKGEDSCDESKRKYESPVIEQQPKKKSTPQDDDLMSISSQSLSRSASPFNSYESDSERTTKSNDHEKHKKMMISDSSNPSSFYPDKFDLIKQRRNRNTEEKWNQIVKEAEKLKDSKRTDKSKSSALSKEKNQKLNETIEKLKVKNAKSKERSVLIDEIFGVKPTQEPRDEKTIFEKLRDSCLDPKAPTTSKKQVPVASKTDPKKPTPDEYDFVDDTAPPVKAPTKKEKATPFGAVEKSSSTVAKKTPAKKVSAAPGIVKKPTTSNKADLEALELETEQTLKDINRWLEHTPRFPEFSSASNSPSRYNLLDDFDAVASKIDPNDFRRPLSITTAKLESPIDEIADNKQEVIEDLIPQPVAATTPGGTPTGPAATTSLTAKPKESSGTTQFLANPPPPPHIKSQQQKDAKRKTLKEKLTGVNRRKDILRTIDRLQPGKAKGNLIGSMHSTSKADELFPPSATNKIKEVKNSLVVKTDETGPKLSMGSVLQTESFGLGQLHNFTDADAEKDTKTRDISPTRDDDPKDIFEKSIGKIDNVEDVQEPIKEKKVEQKTEKQTATPNLSAWFKAFGAPKKAKKAEDDERKAETSGEGVLQQAADRSSVDSGNANNSLNVMKSPPTTETFPLPAPRQRKASTGSTVSERSSFSQDPDSPRVGIDDRFGAYSGPYPSPIGASPIMVSPKPDEIVKPTSPYPLNGAIKVGFYQDTTTKSSPEKSCSPRELPSPYPQYSQHIYSSASSPTVNTDVSNTYSGCYNSNSDANKTPAYSTPAPTSLFDQYKQPRSQESDYNSMSPSTNPNSPYQQPQTSPYQQHQNSPYQQTQNSPYQQTQNSPYQNQAANTPNMLGTSSPNSPGVPQQQQQQQQQQPQNDSPGTQNSPYHQQQNSPYQQPTNSPYHQNPASPYQAPTAQPVQAANMNFVPQPVSNQPNETIQKPPAESTYHPEPPTYSVHESAPQYPAPNRNAMPFEQDYSKRSSAPGILNKMPSQSDWNTQMDLSAPQPHQSPSAPVTLTELNPISHVANQLNTPSLQTSQLAAQLQAEPKVPLQYPNYSQYTGNNGQKDASKQPTMYDTNMTMDMSMGMLRHQQDLNKSAQQQHQQQHANMNKQPPQTSEPNIMNLGGYNDPQSNKMLKPDQSQEKHFDPSQKHQQMFDSFLGSMAGNKNLNFGKPPLNIPPSKAFEMFNRAASMGFPKEFPNPLASQQKSDMSMAGAQLAQQPYGKPLDTQNSDVTGHSQNKPLNMANNSYQHPPMQHHMGDSTDGKLPAYPNSADVNKLQQQQLGATNYSNTDKMTSDLMSSAARQEQMGHNIARNQQLNMDLSNYKTYNNPTAMLDPLRNLNHPLSMMDESLLGLPGSASGGYYEKNIPPAHMFSKNLGQQMYQNPSPYVAPTSRDQQNLGNNYATSVANSVVQPLDTTPEPKPSKRKKKKTAAATTSSTELQSNPNAMLAQQQAHQPQNLQSAQQQGFQLYSDLKTASTVAGTDASAISLKTTSTMVPGSAFNFGPSPTGLPLPAGMYGDNSGYLDPYYLPATHRPADTTGDKSQNAPTAATTPTPYQFLAHNPVRPTYPFMNSQLDPNSPIYQQYIQRQEQELRARMMINQGLLGSGTPAGYPQPGYRPPTLGMPKHYDMSRQTWF